MNMKNELRYIAKTFAGMELVVADELQALGASDIQLLRRAVSFIGDKALMYKLNYCARTILRILKPLAEFEFKTKEQFYSAVFNIDFEPYLDKNATFCVHAGTNNSIFDNDLYVALLTKDAICDNYRDKYDMRPSVDRENPDVIIDVHVFEDKATISLDSSGESLHRRGYKTTQHNAAINEVLAAGLIALSDWKADCDFVDFMCGSGTLLIEAAMFALNMPAGYYRNDYGFMYWADFDEQLWTNIRQEADNAIKEDFAYKIYGSDKSFRYIKDCKMNVEALRLDDIIELSVESFEETDNRGHETCVIINPPYGERLKVDEIEEFYRSIGNVLKKKYINSNVGVITSNKTAMKCFGLKPSRKYTLYNGQLECGYYLYQIYEGSRKHLK